MTFMQVYSGLFLTAAIILGITAAICVVVTLAVIAKHVCYKRELDLTIALRKEVEAQLAMSLEVENFYFVLFLDFINTKDPTTLVYKTTLLRTVVDIMALDNAFVKKIRRAMLRPGGTETIIKSILDPNLPVMEDDTRTAYEKFMASIDELAAVYSNAAHDTEIARHRAGAVSDPTHVPPVVQEVGARTVHEFTSDGTVKLIYDAETAAMLRGIKKEAEDAAIAQQAADDADEE